MNELLTEIQNAAQMIASPNWASIVSIFVSAIAALLAFVVAYRQVGISKQQNKISLFELRYQTYNRILACNHFARVISLVAKANEDILDIYKITIGTNSAPSESQQISDRFLISEMMDFVSELGKAEFLFPQDVVEYSTALSSELVLIISNCLVLNQDYIATGKASLNEILNTFENKKIDIKMVAELRLVAKPNWLKKRIS